MPIGCEVPVSGVITHAETREPWVSITYDEHLGQNTGRILESFADNRMTGTFFTLGEEAEASPEIAREILAQGHELGNHAYHHRMLPNTPDHGLRQYRRAQRAIEQVTGFRTALARPPFGKVNDEVIAAAESLGMTTVMWGRSPAWFADPEHMAEFALDGLQPGRILLFHQNDRGADALPLILRGLLERALRSVAVTQLLGGRFLY